MRRAIVATAGSVVGLVALLSYKSSGAGTPTRVALPPAGPTATTTPTSTAPPPAVGTPPSTAAGGTRTVTGSDVSYRYGNIEIRVTFTGTQIAGITVPIESATDSRSELINSQAIPILTKEALAAQSLNFDVVSGATFTSDAFAQALQSALNKAA